MKSTKSSCYVELLESVRFLGINQIVGATLSIAIAAGWTITSRSGSLYELFGVNPGLISYD